MNDSRPHNPEDLEFLISRALDADLSEDEARRLAQALEGSESLRIEEGRYRSLHDLLGRWASRTAPDASDDSAANVLNRTTLQPIHEDGEADEHRESDQQNPGLRL